MGARKLDIWALKSLKRSMADLAAIETRTPPNRYARAVWEMNMRGIVPLRRWGKKLRKRRLVDMARRANVCRQRRAK